MPPQSGLPLEIPAMAVNLPLGTRLHTSHAAVQALDEAHLGLPGTGQAFQGVLDRLQIPL